MRKLWKVLGALALLLPLCFCGEQACALYRFDDLESTNSGMGTQWVVITSGNYDTVGAKATAMALAVRADLVKDVAPLEVMNGMGWDEEGKFKQGLPEGEREINSILLVTPRTEGPFSVDFGYPYTEAVTADASFWIEGYRARKLASGDKPANAAARYNFWLEKIENRGDPTTCLGDLAFHQNPSSAYYSKPSQTRPVNFLVSNVSGTARENPLLFRSTLRDTSNVYKKGEIMAYDHFDWTVTGNQSVGGGHWVFVPIKGNYPPNEIPYPLELSAANHTALRYVAQRRGDRVWTPRFWSFDLPRTPLLKDNKVARRFHLDPMSHIAPGVQTHFSQSFNLREWNKRAIMVYPADDTYAAVPTPEGTGRFELRLNHNVLFGVDLSTAVSPHRSKYNAPEYRVTAFAPSTDSSYFPYSADFLKRVAERLKTKPLRAPDPDRSQIQLTDKLAPVTVGSSVAAFRLDHRIPASMRAGGRAGVLPLHVTFNIRKDTNRILSDHWEDFLREWFDKGDIHELFLEHFSVYLRSGEPRDWDRENDLNLFEKLREKEDSLSGPRYEQAYEKQFNIFLDEENEIITVHFILMLLDGTRDGFCPALDLVEDQNYKNRNDTYYPEEPPYFMVVRDGNPDNRWDLTCYVAPGTFRDNVPHDHSHRGSGSGGSGCSAGFAGLMSLLLLPVTLNRKVR